jgi:hypothetical protein
LSPAGKHMGEPLARPASSTRCGRRERTYGVRTPGC